MTYSCPDKQSLRCGSTDGIALYLDSQVFATILVKAYRQINKPLCTRCGNEYRHNISDISWVWPARVHNTWHISCSGQPIIRRVLMIRHDIQYHFFHRRYKHHTCTSMTTACTETERSTSACVHISIHLSRRSKTTEGINQPTHSSRTYVCQSPLLMLGVSKTLVIQVH